jgi:hypothetical protein
LSHKPSLINPEILLNASGKDFAALALQVFQYQYKFNVVYQQYCMALKIDPAKVLHVCQIPFLPVSFFKTHKIVSMPDLADQSFADSDNADLIFESSGTTGETPSRHFIWDAGIYEKSLLSGFNQFYGAPDQYAILALLPSYLERKNASLVHMTKTLMEYSGHPDNGFYIIEWEQLHHTIARLEQQGQPTLLLGVTFALLDFAAAYPLTLKHTLIMETGGMKGRREELTRSEVHDILKQQFDLGQIHSEYGMTELLSQAYAKAEGIFSSTNTMKVLVRDINDPLDVKETGTGCINIIDLANIHSCSFIATDDIGTIAPDGTFEVLGRMDHSALRGCSLMAV